MTDANTAAAPKARKSLEEQLLDAKARVAKIEAAITAAAILNNVKVGNDVEFSFGRGDKARTLRGIVTAVKDADENNPRKLARVVCDQGTFDEQAYKVAVVDITRNYSIEDQADAEATEGFDPLGAE